MLEIEDLKYFIEKIDDNKYLRMFNLLIESFNIRYGTKILTFNEFKAKTICAASSNLDLEWTKRDYKNYILDELFQLTQPKEDFMGVVLTVLDFNQNHRKQFNLMHGNGLTLPHYLKEFGTVKLSVGRQTGKTYVALRLLAECDDCIVITPNSNLQKQYKNWVENEEQFKRVFSIKSPLLVLANNHEKFSLIIVDDASLFSKEEIDAIYKSVGKNVEQTFLLLG